MKELMERSFAMRRKEVTGDMTLDETLIRFPFLQKIDTVSCIIHR